MPDIWYDVDVALAEVPVNIAPLVDDTDFKAIEGGVVYNAAGMALRWHFITTAGAYTVTSVTPTTAGVHDWTDQGDSGIYTIEIPASAGTINNDTEGFGWFTGFATGVLPWRGPTLGFRAAALNNALIDGGDLLDTSVTEWNGTAVSAPATAGIPEVNVKNAANVAWASGAITAASIAADAIAAAKIATGAITAAKFAAGAIDAAAIATDAIGAAELAAGAATKIRDTILSDATTFAGADIATIKGYIDTEIASILAAVDTEIATIIAQTVASAIAAAVWNALKASYQVIGSFGHGLQVIATGLVVTQVTTAIAIDTGSATDDAYNTPTGSMMLLIIDGTGVGQQLVITDYVGATKTLTVSDAPLLALDTTSRYIIIGV